MKIITGNMIELLCLSLFWRDPDLGNGASMMTSLEIRDICLNARDEILRLRDRSSSTAEQRDPCVLKSRACSRALPVLEDIANHMLSAFDADAAQIVALIRTAVDAECLPPPRRSTPILVVDNGRTQ